MAAQWPTVSLLLHLSPAVAELQFQEANAPKRETTHPSKNENQGKIPGNLKGHLVADAEMETEMDFVLCRARCFLSLRLRVPVEENRKSVCAALAAVTLLSFAGSFPPCRSGRHCSSSLTPCPTPCSHPTGPGPPSTAISTLPPTQEGPFPSAAV